MKRLAIAIAAIALIGTPAVAADMPVKAPPLPPPPPSWTGFYFGANAGYGWGNNSQPAFIANDPYATALLTANGFGAFGGQPLASPTGRLQGGIGGLQAGYNWQVNRLVFGLEADIQGSSIRESASASVVVNQPSLIATTSTDQQLRWFGTVRARLGFLPTSNWLLYGTGGLAYGQINEHVNVGFGGADPSGTLLGRNGFGSSCVAPPVFGTSAATCFVGTSSRTASGWTAGAGTEWLVTRNVTFKAEYLYVRLGGDSFNVVTQVPLPNFAPSSFRASWGAANVNTVRVGFNYIFN